LFKKIVKSLLYFFLAYLFAGFFILPLILKPQLIKIIEMQTNTQVSIKSLAFNPLIFRLAINDLRLKNLTNEALFSFYSLNLNLNPISLLYGALELKELSLVSPQLYLVYNKDKSINLLNVLKNKKERQKEEPKNSEKSSMPRVIVDKIKLEGGRLFYKDFTRPTPFAFSLENIGFTLNNFDTKKITKNSADLRLYSKLGDGGFIDFKSQILSLTPFKIKGSLAFEASKLYTEWKYMQDVLKLEVADGKVSFNTKFALNLDDLNATKIEDFNLALEKLRIKPKDKEKDILNLDMLYVKNANILPLQQDVKIEKMGLYGLNVKVKRSKNGLIDWLNYIKMQGAQSNRTKKSAAQSSSTKPWSVTLQELDLEKIALRFKDEAVYPNVTTTIDELDVHAQKLTLLGLKPFDYQIKVALNGSGACDINGTLAHRNFNLLANTACKNLDIAHYRPYIETAAKANLKKFDLSLSRAFLDFQVATQVAENNSSFGIAVEDANLSVRELLLRKKSTKEELVKFKDFTIKGIALSTPKRELSVADVELNRFVANLVRQKNGVMNVADIVIPKKSKKSSHKSANKEKAYSVTVKHIALNGAKVGLVDKTLTQNQKHLLDKINIAVNNFDIKKRSWLQYKASLRVNKKGVIRAGGKLRHTPLKQNGFLSARRLSLTDLTPYLQEKSYLRVDDGRLSFKIKESYAHSKKYPDLRIKGEAALNSLFVSNTNDANSSLFSLNELRVKPFTLELFPNRLYVDEVDIDSFYITAELDANKTTNFAKLMKKGTQAQEQKPKQEVKKEAKASAFPVKVVKINVKNGSAAFSDLSLPIKFKTQIHGLEGAFYAVSSTPGDTTYVDIDGEVDKYGSTKLIGSVDSFNPKEYTDLNFNFKNLDLHAMSGYSASFAGYEINSGKLYLDLGYEIMHGQLNATNNIMIKEIKLGKELESEDVNHLPLGFVIGLLEDSEGIIDIDMPIAGNVDAPDFKYGTLVWKTLGNLIAKAVTSPFKFLGSMMGLDGEDLEFIAFEFGKSDITPPQREKLDKIVKLMRKRPKINLEVSAVYDDVNDLKALKLQKLVAMVIKKSGDENIKNSKNALNIDMLEDVYAQLRKDDKLEKLQEKLQKEYKDKDAYKRAYQNSLIELCTQIQPVSEQDLKFLANKRAEEIQTYLVQEKALEPRRVLKSGLVKLHKADEKVVKLTLNIEVQSVGK